MQKGQKHTKLTPLARKKQRQQVGMSPEDEGSGTRGYSQVNLDALEERRLTEVAHVAALDAAFQVKNILAENDLNIVTAESLTAGLIAKTLVDVPGSGVTVYGNFTVYDTDAKRVFLQVATKGVYSHKTAREMAEGALANSRAMVAVSVTGNSMPFPDHRQQIGIVHIGVSLRLKDPKSGENYFETFSRKIEICRRKEVFNLCEAWKKLNEGGNFAPYQYTALLSDYIRYRTVSESLLEVKSVIENALQRNVTWGTITKEIYDDVCRPSWMIYKHIDEYSKTDYNNIKDGCSDGEDDSLIESLSHLDLNVGPFFTDSKEESEEESEEDN
jgi:PncC family amidohydrolase